MRIELSQGLIHDVSSLSNNDKERCWKIWMVTSRKMKNSVFGPKNKQWTWLTRHGKNGSPNTNRLANKLVLVRFHASYSFHILFVFLNPSLITDQKKFFFPSVNWSLMRLTALFDPIHEPGTSVQFDTSDVVPSIVLPVLCYINSYTATHLSTTNVWIRTQHGTQHTSP